MWTIEHDGYEITAYISAYMDYGLMIEKDGETVFNNPTFLSNDGYGFYMDEDSDEDTVTWTDEEWLEQLKEEADSLLEAAGIE